MLTAAPFPADAVFPTLQDALDPVSAAKAFSQALRAKGQNFDSLECIVERSRIKRGRKALLGYRLLGRTGDGSVVDQRAMLVLYPGGDPASLPDMSGTPHPLGTSPEPVGLTISALGGAAWFFPGDRKVHGIATMLTQREGNFEVIHYVPEQGCTVKLIEPNGRILYGKCRADDRGRVAAQFGAERFIASGSLRLARIIAHDPDSRILWQEGIAGTALDSARVLSEPRLWAGRIAHALRDMHALSPPKSLKRLTYKSAAKTLQSRIARSCAAMPDLASRLGLIGQRLSAHWPPETALVTSHCDLHPANLLWDGTSFALIDLDTVALAPPAFDHATLAAALTHKAIEREAGDDAIATMVDALRTNAGGEGIDGSAFDWAFAASLVGERLYRCATRLKSPSPQVRGRLLAQAEQAGGRHA